MCSNGPIQDIKASNSRFRYTISRFSFRNQTENDAVCVPLGWLLITLCLQLQKHLTKEKWKKNHVHNYGRVTQAKLMNSLRKGYSIYSRVVDGKLASIGSHYSANA